MMENSPSVGADTEGPNDGPGTRVRNHNTAVEDTMDITADMISGVGGNAGIVLSTLNVPPPSYEEVFETTMKEKGSGTEAKGKQMKTEEENEE